MEIYENSYKKNFSFWKNWQNFLKKINDENIDKAKEIILKFLWDENIIKWNTIIDFWSWSWLMSLAFLELWVKEIISIDIDDYSIECAEYLREKYKYNKKKWKILKGSVLDENFIKSLPKVDMLYSWWVIHHTWDMWKWLDLMLNLIKDNWYFYTAIYNDSNFILEWTSKFWLKEKRIYSKYKFLRYIIKPIYTFYYITWLIIHWINPIKYIKNYSFSRWMSFWNDIEDWLGWYPYEYATFDEIQSFFEKNNYKLLNSKKVRSIWCNEFLFKKI